MERILLHVPARAAPARAGQPDAVIHSATNERAVERARVGRKNQIKSNQKSRESSFAKDVVRRRRRRRRRRREVAMSRDADARSSTATSRVGTSRVTTRDRRPRVERLSAHSWHRPWYWSVGHLVTRSVGRPLGRSVTRSVDHSIVIRARRPISILDSRPISVDLERRSRLDFSML